MRLHFFIGGYDYRGTTRFRQGIHFSIIQLLFADHMHRRAGVDNKFSFLRFKIWCRLAPIFRMWEECCFVFLLEFLRYFLANLHAASRAPCSCHSVSSWDRSSNFGALGATLMSSLGQIIPSEGWSRIFAWRATAGIMDDSVQCWSDLRIEYFKIRHVNSFYRTRRLRSSAHFFDPQQSFRRKLWTSTYLGLELLSSNKQTLLLWGICRNEDLKSAVVVGLPHNSLKSSLTGDEWISGWRSGLASLILKWCLILILLRWWWVNWFWYMRTPWIQFLQIRRWRRRGWICKNVSWFSMCVPNAWRPFFAARHSYRTAWHSTRNKIRFGKDTGWLVTWECPLRTDSASWKPSRIIHTINFILQFQWVQG